MNVQVLKGEVLFMVLDDTLDCPLDCGSVMTESLDSFSQEFPFALNSLCCMSVSSILQFPFLGWSPV